MSHRLALLPAPWRALALAALLSVALGGATLEWLTPRSAAPARIASSPLSQQERSHLPTGALGALSAVLGAREHSYAVTPRAGGLRAMDAPQRLQADFRPVGVLLRSGGVRVALSLRAAGYGRSLRALGQVSPSASANHVLYARGALSEWYVNGPLGLEQGFTLARALAPRAGGPLTLSLALSSNAHPTLGAAGSLLLGRGGGSSLRYGAPAASDAQGHALHSWLELHGGRLLLRVDASSARYPLRIDPLIQQGEKLTGAGSVGESGLGRGVALSGDGNTALVGGAGDGGGVGAAWVFTRSGTTWTQQAELKGAEAGGKAAFGSSVSLSSDGNTALVGAPHDSGEPGAAWVFTRSGSAWSAQGTKLTGSEEIGESEFGDSVALSSDGSTALIGGWGDNISIGAAWVFSRSGSAWSQQGAKLTGAGEIGTGEFGYSVALSFDGNTAMIGSFTGEGAWAFTRSGSTWSQQGTKLTATGEIGEGDFGSSVSLSSDGNTALIGASHDNGGAGAAWSFTRSGSTWSQQGTKITGGGELGKGYVGESAALSGDGNTALIGGLGDNGLIGAAWVFTRSGSAWSQQGSKLTGGGEVGEGRFATSVALSLDGVTALIGAPSDASGLGAAWPFSSGVTAPSVTSVTPGEGPAGGGTSVTIAGTNFTGASAVRFGSANAASFKVTSASSITAVSPAGAATVDVTVTTSGGTSIVNSADHFTYIPAGPAPTVNGISPNGGPVGGGTVVTIKGTSLTGATSVKFGSVQAASFTVKSATSISAVSPAGQAGTVDLTVTTPGGTSALVPKDRFSYAPTVSGVSPSTGPKAGGTEVTVTGTGFALGTGATSFKFGGAVAKKVSCTSSTTCLVRAPSARTTGAVDVTAKVAGASSAKNPPADSFTYA
jgi:hypothetical protein